MVVGSNANHSTPSAYYVKVIIADTDNGVRVLFSNIGKSAAPFYVYGQVESSEFILGNVEYDSIDFGENPYCNVVAFFKAPTNTAFPSTNFANLNTGAKVEKLLVNSLLDSTKKVTAIFRGCIFYKEGEIIHRTGFCYVIAQGKKLSDPSNTPICDKGNFSY